MQISVLERMNSEDNTKNVFNFSEESTHVPDDRNRSDVHH